MELEDTPFHLDDVLNHVSTVIRPMAEGKHLEFRIEPGPDLPSALRGDPLRLGQVLTNLAGNAVKFTETGEIVVGITVEGADDLSTTLRFSVRDTGIGLEAARRQHLFDAFTQADGSTTRQFGGTGLGLAICRNLVELMDGDIGVDSTPGRGSTFTFTARFGNVDTIPAAAPAETRAAEAPRLDGVQVLLVEDNEINRQVAREILTDAGATVTEAENGRAGFDMAMSNARDIDIILMDLQMPIMDGFEATEAILECLGDAAPPIVAMTAHVMEEERRNCLNAGMKDHISKPLSSTNLLSAITRHARRRVDAEPVPPGTPKPEANVTSKLADVPRESPYDLTDAVERLGLDEATVIEILNNFRDRYRNLRDDMAPLLADGDLAALAALAHSIKGASGSIGANRVHAASAALEHAARDGDDAAARRLAVELDEALAALGHALVAAGHSAD